MAVVTTDHTFVSGGVDCAAWVLRPDDPTPPSGRPVVVLGHGLSLTRHDGLLSYAEAFAAAGAVAVVFDFRHLGDSGGQPRQRFRASEQRDDYRAATAFARSQHDADLRKIVLWGYSMSGAHVLRLARELQPAAVLTLCAFADGRARVRATPPSVSARLAPRAVRDVAGRHNLVPVAAAPGELAAMTLPGELDGFLAVRGAGSPWRNEISPGMFLSVGFDRAVTKAADVTMPLWVGLGEHDVTVSGPALERLAAEAPGAELHRYDVDHFGALHGETPAVVAADQVDFLRRHGLVPRG